VGGLKNMRMVTVICWLITAFVLIGFGVWFLTGSVFGIWSDGWNRDSMWFSGINIGGWERLSGPYNVAGTYSYGITGVDALNIDWIAGDITVKPYDGSNIQITELAQRELLEHERLYVSMSGGTVSIRYIEKSNVGRMPQKKLEVLVPRALSDNMSRLSVDAVSGAVFIENVRADTLDSNTMSGHISITNCAAGTFRMDSTSGALTATSIRSDNMNLNSMSGTVRVSQSSAKTFDCDTTSGSVSVTGAFDSVNLNSMSGRLTLDNSASASTVYADSTSGALELSGSFSKVNTNSMSGSITIKSMIIPGDLKAETTSGNIVVAVPNDGTVTVDYSAVSGRFSSDIPVIMQKNGAQFRISSMSGNARIIELD